MGAAQSTPIPSPNMSAISSESVCEVNPLNPKGLKPYAIQSILYSSMVSDATLRRLDVAHAQKQNRPVTIVF
jgi:hypothetical protein